MRSPAIYRFSDLLCLRRDKIGDPARIHSSPQEETSTGTLWILQRRTTVTSLIKRRIYKESRKATITWIILTLEYIQSDLAVKPLNYANVFLEHIDDCYLYNEQVDITLIVDLSNPIDQTNKLHTRDKQSKNQV